MEFTESNVLNFPILTIITFLPLVGAITIIFINSLDTKLIKGVGLTFFIITFLVSLLLFFIFDSNDAGMQFTEKINWYPSLGIYYHLGIDGISLLLVLLTTFLGPIVMLSSFNSITKYLKGYTILLLILQTGMIGTFVSINMFLFYIFWESMLIPIYLLIGIWGGNFRIYAAVKFFIYTAIGSLLMLVAILYIYYLGYQQGLGFTFELSDFYKIAIPIKAQIYLFLAFVIPFAIKVPIFPLHTWLPDAHVEAPTGGSVILAGILLKMGAYGFIRFAMPLFPLMVIKYGIYFIVLAVIGIIYGALVAMVQPDLKKLVAYSSLSHLGFVILGLFMVNTQSVQGGILQMINHGLSTGALFLMVGMLYERRDTRLISEFGGLATQIPIFSAFFMIITLSSIGLPGTNGFVGEFLTLVGSYKKSIAGIILGQYHLIILVILASLGVVLSAVYMLWMYQRVIFGKITKEENKKIEDLTLREKLVLIPIIALIFIIGFYPSPFLSKIEKNVQKFNTHINKTQNPILKSFSSDTNKKIILQKEDNNKKDEIKR